MVRIPPRKFSDEEIRSAKDFLQRHSPEDWAMLLAAKDAPLDEQAARGFPLRFIRALIKEGFVDNLAHGSSLFLKVLNLAWDYRTPVS